MHQSGRKVIRARRTVDLSVFALGKSSPGKTLLFLPVPWAMASTFSGLGRKVGWVDFSFDFGWDWIVCFRVLVMPCLLNN